mgnify:CR=1 FL=1|jgi:hypothetical protein
MFGGQGEEGDGEGRFGKAVDLDEKEEAIEADKEKAGTKHVFSSVWI